MIKDEPDDAHKIILTALARRRSGPPQAACAGATDGTDVVFRWRPPQNPEGDGVADYHFELSERADMAWPLSSNFSKLVSNTADRSQPRYSLTRIAAGDFDAYLTSWADGIKAWGQPLRIRFAHEANQRMRSSMRRRSASSCRFAARMASAMLPHPVQTGEACPSPLFSRAS